MGPVKLGVQGTGPMGSRGPEWKGEFQTAGRLQNHSERTGGFVSRHHPGNSRWYSQVYITGPDPKGSPEWNPRGGMHGPRKEDQPGLVEVLKGDKGLGCPQRNAHSGYGFFGAGNLRQVSSTNCRERSSRINKERERKIINSQNTFTCGSER